MKKQIDDAMSKIKLWQEECKLVALFFGAVTTVAVFFRQLFMGKIGLESMSMKSMESGGGAPAVSESYKMIVSAPVHSSPDYVLIISAMLFVVFVGLGIYYIVKIIKKHRKES